MVLGLKFTCTCHQAKITLCCQTPLVAPIDQKICRGGVSYYAASKFAIRFAP